MNIINFFREQWDINFYMFHEGKKEDKKKGYLKMVVDILARHNIPCSYLDREIDSNNIDTVIGVLRNDYMNNKPVTIFLIGENSFEDTRAKWLNNPLSSFMSHDEYNEQSFIIRECASKKYKNYIEVLFTD